MTQSDTINTKQRTQITGIGSALVDILINESDDFLKKFNKAKGGMTLVDDADIQKILAGTNQKPLTVPGGAACNTIMGVGRLGGKACFIGHRGNDDYGRHFEDQLIKNRVEPVMFVSDAPTGKVLSVITPDAQRSMFTFLGASTEFDPSAVKAQMFNKTAIAVIEGYLLFNPDLIMAALKAAKTAGAMIALDLASFEVVNSSKEILDDIIKNYIDILIANEDEAKAFTGFSEEDKAIEALSEKAAYAVLKVGEKGSYIAHNKNIVKIPAQKGKAPVDTTGAGDLWASGFLFGLAHGFSIEKSGRLGSACGYEVCQVMGAHIPQNAWERIRQIAGVADR